MNAIEMKHHWSSEWKFSLDIPKRWHSLPPVSTNSPNEVSKEDGAHLLILFREIHDPKQGLKQISDAVRDVLAGHGFGNFVRAETNIGPRVVLTLDFDRPKDSGTWSCRHYFIAEDTSCMIGWQRVLSSRQADGHGKPPVRIPEGWRAPGRCALMRIKFFQRQTVQVLFGGDPQQIAIYLQVLD